MNCCNTNHEVARELSTFINPQLATILSTPVGRELAPICNGCLCGLLPGGRRFFDFDREFNMRAEFGSRIIDRELECCLMNINRCC